MATIRTLFFDASKALVNYVKEKSCIESKHECVEVNLSFSPDESERVG